MTDPQAKCERLSAEELQKYLYTLMCSGGSHLKSTIEGHIAALEAELIEAGAEIARADYATRRAVEERDALKAELAEARYHLINGSPETIKDIAMLRAGRDAALARAARLEKAVSYASSVFSELHVREAAECHTVYFAFKEALAALSSDQAPATEGEGTCLKT